MKLRAALSLLLAISIVQFGKQLWLIIWTLHATAPDSATLAGYVDGIIFVSMMMWAFSPDFRTSIVIGALSASLAVALWGVQPVYRRVRS